MKKLLSATVAACMLAAPVAADVKVGMITTLSGGGGYLGVDVRDGFNLAIQQSGRTDIEVIVEDDARKPDVAKSIADKFIQKEKVDILTGIIWSNLLLAVAPGATRGGTFYISPNAGPSALAGKNCHENYFNTSWQNNTLSEAMGTYFKEQSIGKPFLLAPNYPAGKDILNGFKQNYGDVQGELYTKLGQNDYAAEIAQIKASGAESIYFFLPGGMGIAFMKQYAASGATIPVYGPAFSFDETLLGAIGDGAVGVLNTSQWSLDTDNAVNKAFVTDFEAAYGRKPTLYASQGFDTGLLVVSALSKADPSDKDAFRAALRAADFAASRGNFSFNNNHHPIQDVYMRKVVAGEGKPTNVTVGTAVVAQKDSFAKDCPMNW